jgi:hypothetical protein
MRPNGSPINVMLTCIGKYRDDEAMGTQQLMRDSKYRVAALRDEPA